MINEKEQIDKKGQADKKIRMVKCQRYNNHVPVTKCKHCGCLRSMTAHAIYCKTDSHNFAKQKRIEEYIRCSICGKLFRIGRHSEEKCLNERVRREKEETIRNQVEHNVRILTETSEYTQEYRWRRSAAIYRLYRYYDYKPQQLADLLGCSAHSIEKTIGEVFSYLCTHDDSCVFKEVLDGKHRGK